MVDGPSSTPMRIYYVAVATAGEVLQSRPTAAAFALGRQPRSIAQSSKTSSCVDAADPNDAVGSRATRPVGEILPRELPADIGGHRRSRAKGSAAKTRKPRGDLKVAAPIAFGRLHVLPVVNRMLTEPPRPVGAADPVGSQMCRWWTKASTSPVRIGDLADSSLIAVKLGAVSRVLVASPAYLARHGAPSSPCGSRRPRRDRVREPGCDERVAVQ